jgi:predicted amidohydrolase
MRVAGSWLLPLSILLVACATDDSDKADGGGGKPPDAKVVTPDQKLLPDVRPAGIYRVAAIQYASDQFAAVDKSCKDDVCALSKLVEQAASKGAQLVVAPEYATGQKVTELTPQIGDRISDDQRWADGTITKTFGRLADRLDATVVFNLITQDDPDDSKAKLFNTSVAVDPDGKVVARHFKMELFGGESKDMTAGSSIETSFFDTPVGKAGLLICADAQCIVTNLSPGPSCSSHVPKLLLDYFSNKKPKLVAFSAYWTVGSGIWGSMAVQKKIAKDGTAWVVGANTTEGDGKGGGIWKPGGEEAATTTDGKFSIQMWDIPLK